jgi:hypothetical protein
MREYAAANAESWYRYINGPRGRGLANGLLYLVTGWEKAQSWGMASFYSVSNELQLAFRPTRKANSPPQYRWSGNPAQKKSYDPSPISDRPLNQTTFIHGLSISLGTTIFGRLFGTVGIREIVESQLGSARGTSMSPSQGSSLFAWTLRFLGGGATGGKQYVGQNGPVLLSDLSPISKAQNF